MFLTRHLDAFKIYIFLLVISLSITISGTPEYPFVNFITYLFIHFLLIYLGIYHFKFILYFVYFFAGIIFDIFLLNEIGPHLLIFMILIFILSQLQKFLNIFTSFKIFALILVILFISFSLEKFLSLILYNFDFDLNDFLKFIIFSIFLSYPIFYLFNKIDRFG